MIFEVSDLGVKVCGKCVCFGNNALSSTHRPEPAVKHMIPYVVLIVDSSLTCEVGRHSGCEMVHSQAQATVFSQVR